MSRRTTLHVITAADLESGDAYRSWSDPDGIAQLYEEYR